MDTAKSGIKNIYKTKRFIILVPHRDARKLLDEYRQKLFSAGIYSSFSFPASAVLAEVSHPFSGEELKTLARNIRSLTEKTGGKILTDILRKSPGGPVAATCCTASSQFSFYGPSLSLSVGEGVFPGSSKGKLLCILNPLVLCTALAGENLNNMEAPAISFRAAYVANLAIRQIAGPDFSFEWKKDKPVWLPKVKNV